VHDTALTSCFFYQIYEMLHKHGPRAVLSLEQGFHYSPCHQVWWIKSATIYRAADLGIARCRGHAERFHRRKERLHWQAPGCCTSDCVAECPRHIACYNHSTSSTQTNRRSL